MLRWPDNMLRIWSMPRMLHIYLWLTTGWNGLGMLTIMCVCIPIGRVYFKAMGFKNLVSSTVTISGTKSLTGTIVLTWIFLISSKHRSWAENKAATLKSITQHCATKEHYFTQMAHTSSDTVLVALSSLVQSKTLKFPLWTSGQSSPFGFST